MSGEEFTDWMKQKGLRVADVAVHTKLDPNTIYAFRRGQDVRRTTEDIINRFVKEFEAKRVKEPASA